MSIPKRTAFIVIATLLLLGIHYRFGYPLRNAIDHSLCVNAFLATASFNSHEVFFPTERKLSRAPASNCRAALVIDNRSHEVLYSKRADEVRSIASLTKLMTAMVLIDMDFDWAKVVKIGFDDARNSARSRLKVGEKFYASDLFYIMLINSDNRAARALARSTGLSREDFAARMNAKAKSLGMFKSVFVEPSGLDERNVSTASDCAKMLNAALQETLISAAVRTYKYSYRSINHKRRRDIVNTNRLLTSGWQVRGGKTGYIRASGYCFSTRLCDEKGHDLTIVVLGSPWKGTRFTVARRLANWAFKNLEKYDAEECHVAGRELTAGVD